jgi:hypothetical protein
MTRAKFPLHKALDPRTEMSAPGPDAFLSGPLSRSIVRVVAYLSLFACAFAGAGELAPGLTPVGAEQTSNEDGTIPVWTGGIVAPPGFKTGGKYVDPYPEDRPLFTITAANQRDHTAKLSEGHRTLLSQYPGFEMPIYASRRTVVYPERVNAGTRANLGRARLGGVDILENAQIGFPFAMPKSGVEVLWNHRVRWRGENSRWEDTAATVMPNGMQRRSSIDEWNLYRNASDSVMRDGILFYTIYRRNSVKNCGKALWLWHEPLNPVHRKRQNWYHCAAWRGGRAPPDLGHDDYSWGGNGLMYFDMGDMFVGEFSRYTFKLLGKREIYLPYNAYRLADGSVGLDHILMPLHLRPEMTRYELHRAWIVEATLRPGETHRVKKRVFYVDEDSWTIALVDVYEDPRVKPSRVQEGHLTLLYDVQAVEPMPQLVYGLDSRTYYALRLIAENKPPRFNTPDIRPGMFSPTALKGAVDR